MQVRTCLHFGRCAVGNRPETGLSQPKVTEFCIDDSCLPRAPDGFVAAGEIPVADEPGEHSYRIVFAGGARQPRTIEGTVATKEYIVNGPGCGPVTANATLTVHPDGGVDASHP